MDKKQTKKAIISYQAEKVISRNNRKDYEMINNL
jgi:hypothetical protein